MIPQSNRSFISKFFLFFLFLYQPLTFFGSSSIYYFNVKNNNPNLEIYEHAVPGTTKSSRKSKSKPHVKFNATGSAFPQMEIFERKNFTNVTTSKMLEIDFFDSNSTGELVIKGPREYRINFTPEGFLVEEEKSKHHKSKPKTHSPKSRRSKGSKGSSKRSPKSSADYDPIQVAINKLVFLNEEKENSASQDVTSESGNYGVKISKEDVLYSGYDRSKKRSKKGSGKHKKSDIRKNDREYVRTNGESIIKLDQSYYQNNVKDLIDSSAKERQSKSHKKERKGSQGSPSHSKEASPEWVTQNDILKNQIFNSASGRDSYDSDYSYSSGSYNNGSPGSNSGTGSYTQHIYPLGFYRLIVRQQNNEAPVVDLTAQNGGGEGGGGPGLVGASGQKMQIAIIDERLALQVNDGNPGEVANYFDKITMEPVGKISNFKDIVERINVSTLNQDIETIRNVLLSLPNISALASALNLMHPAKFADLSLILFNNHSLLYSNICRHFEEISFCPSPCNRFDVWTKVFGNFQTIKTSGAQTGYHDKTGGVLVGVDFIPREGLCLGAAFAYTHDDVTWHRREADAKIDTYYGLLYSSLRLQNGFLEAMGSFGYSRIDGHRHIRATEFLDRKASHDNHALTYAGRVSGGFNFALPCDVTMQIFDAFDLGNVKNRAFREHGATALNLHVRKHHALHVRNEVGIQISRDYLSNCQTTCWTPAIALKWIYQNPISKRSVRASFQHQNSTFRLKTRRKHTNQISPEASVTINSEDGIYLSAYYEGAFGDGWNSNEVGLHFGKSF